MDQIKLEVNRKRNFSAHHMLLGSARLALESAEGRSPGYFYSELTTITFCGLALEAIANSFGGRFVPNWKDFESSSLIAKLQIICKELNVDFQPDQEPWGTAKWIIKFRNKIAHAKLEIIDIKEVCSADEYNSRRVHTPKSKLEQMITKENARKAYDTTKEILDILCDQIPDEVADGLRRDGWSGSATLYNN